MKLILEKPPEDAEGAVYSLPFGFTGCGDECEGVFAVTENEIKIYINGALDSVCDIRDFSEFVCRRGADAARDGSRCRDGRAGHLWQSLGICWCAWIAAG